MCDQCTHSTVYAACHRALRQDCFLRLHLLQRGLHFVNAQLNSHVNHHLRSIRTIMRKCMPPGTHGMGFNLGHRRSLRRPRWWAPWCPSCCELAGLRLHLRRTKPCSRRRDRRAPGQRPARPRCPWWRIWPPSCPLSGWAVPELGRRSACRGVRTSRRGRRSR